MTERRNIPALTGLRIFAALAVYLSHIGAPAGSSANLHRFFGSGYIGVSLFFILSGFVLTWRYFEDLARPTGRKVWNFFVARFARIYPLYLLVLGYIVLYKTANNLPIESVTPHALAVQTWMPDVMHAYAFNAPSWSISVEFFLYACFPLLIFVLAKLPRIVLGVLAALIVVALFVVAWRFSLNDVRFDFGAASSHRWLYRFPPARLGDFTLGIITARLCMSVGRSRVGGWLAGTGLITIAVLMCSQSLFYTAWTWDAAYAIPATMVIGGLAVATPRSLLARALSRPMVVLLGEASFAFYLIHVQMINTFGVDLWRAGWSWSVAGLAAMQLTLTLCVAVGLNTLVEIPARRRLTRMLRMREPGPPAPLPPSRPVCLPTPERDLELV